MQLAVHDVASFAVVSYGDVNRIAVVGAVAPASIVGLYSCSGNAYLIKYLSGTSALPI